MILHFVIVAVGEIMISCNDNSFLWLQVVIDWTSCTVGINPGVYWSALEASTRCLYHERQQWPEEPHSLKLQRVITQGRRQGMRYLCFSSELGKLRWNWNKLPRTCVLCLGLLRIRGANRNTSNLKQINRVVQINYSLFKGVLLFVYKSCCLLLLEVTIPTRTGWRL